MKLILIIVSFWCVTQGYAQEKSDTSRSVILDSLIGKPCRDFDLTTIDGKNYKLSELKGKVVVLNFWFMQCQPCLAEFPLLNQVVKEYENKDVVFLALSTTGKPENLRVLIKRRPLAYEVVSTTLEEAGKFHVDLFPTNFVIDKEGYFVYASDGYHQDIHQKLSKSIADALNK